MRKSVLVCSLVIFALLTSCWKEDAAESMDTSLSSEESTSVTTESASVESNVSESDSIEVEEFNLVNRVLQDVYTSDEYQEMSNEDRVNYYLELLHDIAVNGIEPYNYPLIEEDSIVYIEEDNEIHFYYRSGLPGCVVIDYSSEESVEETESVSLELQEMRVVNQRLHDISESDEYRNMSQEERVNYFLDVLYDIAESGIDPFNYPLIEADSIVYFEEENEIRFNYINGAPAFIPIDDPAYGEDLQVD